MNLWVVTNVHNNNLWPSLASSETLHTLTHPQKLVPELMPDATKLAFCVRDPGLNPL